MRLVRLATPIAVLCLTLAACGGASDATVQEVPGGPVKLTVPGGDALAPKATATATSDASETPTPVATSTPAANTAPQGTTQSNTTTQTAPQGTQGGGAAAPDGNPQATPPPGSDAQQFEEFCQQNPGAC